MKIAQIAPLYEAVPPKVRLGLSNRPLEIDELLKSLKLPVLI